MLTFYVRYYSFKKPYKLKIEEMHMLFPSDTVVFPNPRENVNFNDTVTISCLPSNHDINRNDSKRCSHWNHVSGDRVLMEQIQYTFDTMKTLLTVSKMYS